MNESSKPDLPVDGCKLYCNQPQCITSKGNKMYSLKVDTYKKHMKDCHPQLYTSVFGGMNDTVQVNSPMVLTKFSSNEDLKKSKERVNTKKIYSR